MKIWKSFSGEHSANLRIIGTFNSSEAAEKAVNCFNDLLAVKDKSKGRNLYFSDELMAVMDKHNFRLFDENDAQQLDYFGRLAAQNTEIIVRTDEVEIQALLKVFIHYGAKIMVYSRDNYPDG